MCAGRPLRRPRSSKISRRCDQSPRASCRPVWRAIACEVVRGLGEARALVHLPAAFLLQCGKDLVEDGRALERLRPR